MATGIAVAGGGVGGLLYAPVIQSLLDHYDWRFVLRCLALFNLIVQSICSYFITKKVPPAGSSTAANIPNSSGVDIEKQEQGSSRSDLRGEDMEGDKDIEMIDKSQRAVQDKSNEVIAPGPSEKLYEDPVFLSLFIGSFIVGFGYFVPFYYLPQYVTDHGMSKDFGVGYKDRRKGVILHLYIDR